MAVKAAQQEGQPKCSVTIGDRITARGVPPSCSSLLVWVPRVVMRIRNPLTYRG